MKRRKTTTGNLTRLLGSASTPLFILNAQRRVLVFNRGCEELTGWPADEIIGRTCHYGSTGESPQDELTAGLCPPPTVFAGEEASVPAYLTDRQGQALPRMLNFFPFRAEDGGVTHVLGTGITPLSNPPAVWSMPPTCKSCMPSWRPCAEICEHDLADKRSSAKVLLL